MPEFRSVKTRRVSDEVGEEIRRLLASGQLKTGDKLPPERELALQLGVGRNALREALRSLEKSGVLTLQRGAKGGAFISQGDTAALSRGLSDLLQLRAISMEHLTQARVAIADGVTRAAAVSATEDDFARLEARLDSAQAALDAGDMDQKLFHIIEFHNDLAQSTQNPVLVLVMRSIMDLMYGYSKEVGGEPNDASIAGLRRFVGHLKKRHPKAASIEMTDHLDRAQARYMRTLRSHPPIVPSAPDAPAMPGKAPRATARPT